jgi:hypothetical protein
LLSHRYGRPAHTIPQRRYYTDTQSRLLCHRSRHWCLGRQRDRPQIRQSASTRHRTSPCRRLVDHGFPSRQSGSLARPLPVSAPSCDCVQPDANPFLSIPWHVGSGLSWQFLERKEEILSTLGDLSSFNRNCDSWRRYWDVPANPSRPYEMDDSGL